MRQKRIVEEDGEAKTGTGDNDDFDSDEIQKIIEMDSKDSKQTDKNKPVKKQMKMKPSVGQKRAFDFQEDDAKSLLF